MRPPAPTQLQIYGERCSGTNFVAQLLRRNFPRLSLTDRYGWKHGFVHGLDDAVPDCLFVVVTRDPLDWIRSLHQKPWHAATPLREVTLAEFVRQPWWCEWGRDMQLLADDARLGTEMMHERDPETGERFANVMKLRASKLRNWFALSERVQHYLAVRYEDAAADPRGLVREVAQRFGIRRWPWLRSVKTFKGGRERFVKKQYEPIPSVDRDWIVSQLDLPLERAAGYQPLQ